MNPDGEAGPLLLPACQDVARNGGRERRADAPAGGFVRDRRRRAALEDDRLEPLGAHHGAHSHTLGLMGAAADDAGEANLIFAGRPDHGDLGVRAEPALQRVRRLVCGQPPLPGRVEERHRAVLDQEARGTLGHTVEDERIVARALQRDAPGAFDAGLADAAGERRLGANHVAHQARQRVTADGAVGEDQQVLRPQRVDAGRRSLQQQAGGEHAGAAGDAVLQVRHVLDPARPAAEVHVQQPAVKAVPAHRVVLPMMPGQRATRGIQRVA